MSEVTIRARLAYTPPLGVLVTLPEMTLTCPYSALNVATIDIPDATANPSTFAVPFGSIDEATLIVLSSNMSEDVLVKINGTDLVYTLTAGEKMMFAASALGTTSIASVDITTTAVQAGDESVDCMIFGDPL